MPRQLFDLMVGSIINRLIFGERLDDNNAKGFHESKENLGKVSGNFSVLDMLFEMEWIRELPLFRTRWKQLTEPQYIVAEYLTDQVRQRLRNVESGKHAIPHVPEDYTDAFIVKMKEEQKLGVPTTFTEEALIFNIYDLWIAGQETTVNTLSFSLAYLLNSREEVQRLASILNLIFYRKTVDDTQIGDYFLQRGTPIAAQISLIMSDEKLFEETTKFDPRRYLADDNLERHVVAFGVGKRSCPGEPMAKAELYLILGNMLLRYKFEQAGELPATESLNNFGVFRRCPLYNMKISQTAVKLPR